MTKPLESFNVPPRLGEPVNVLQYEMHELRSAVHTKVAAGECRFHPQRERWRWKLPATYWAVLCRWSLLRQVVNDRWPAELSPWGTAKEDFSHNDACLEFTAQFGDMNYPKRFWESYGAPRWCVVNFEFITGNYSGPGRGHTMCAFMFFGKDAKMLAARGLLYFNSKLPGDADNTAARSAAGTTQLYGMLGVQPTVLQKQHLQTHSNAQIQEIRDRMARAMGHLTQEQMETLFFKSPFTPPAPLPTYTPEPEKDEQEG